MFEVSESGESARDLMKVEQWRRKAGLDNVFSNLRSKDHELLKIFFPDLEILGSGDESIVLGSEVNPERVVSLGIDFRKRDGVLPFAELYQMHKLASLLYPDYFPDMYGARGFGYRDTERKQMPKNYMIISGDVWKGQKAGDKIEKELAAAGIDFHLDPVYLNYAVSESGNVMYVDIFDKGLKSVENMKTEEVWRIFEKNNRKMESADYEKKKKHLERCIRRIRELGVINKIFQKISDGGRYPDLKKYEIEVADMVAGNDVFDEKSVGNIMRVIQKAVDFSIATGQKYDEGWNF